MKLIVLFFLLFTCLLLRTNALEKRASKTKTKTSRLINRPNPNYIVTSVLSKPFLMLKDDGSTGNDAFEGYVKDLIELLAEKVGFDYELQLQKESKYGSQYADGQWTGMIGEVIRKEADIAIADLTINNERAKAIDFTIPFMKAGISVMIKRPSVFHEGTFFFLIPFTSDLWLSIFFAGIGVAIVFFIVSKFSSYDVKEKEDFNKQTSTKDKIWSTLRTILRHQSETRKSSCSKIIVASFFGFFAIVLIALYTANLTLFLSTKQVSLPVKDIDELSRQSNIEYGLIKGGSTNQFFQSSNIDTYQRMYSSMKQRENGLLPTSQAGIEMVKNSNGKYAFILESVFNDYVNGQPPCDTIRLGSDLNEVGYGIAIAEGQPGLRARLNAALIELKMDGTLAALKNKWWFKNLECDQKMKNGLEGITLCNAAGLFYILTAGLILSLLVAVFEYRCRSKQADADMNNFVESCVASL